MSEMDFSKAGEAKDQLTLGAKYARDLDARLEEKEKARRPFPVLSLSMFTGECVRRMAYEYFLEIEASKTYKELERSGQLEKWEARKKFDGKMLRIFADGTRDEDVMAAELRSLGFVLATHDDQGKQFGFKAAFEGDWARLRGRIDGIVLESPYPEIKTPCLWENKALNHKTSTAMRSGGLKKTKPNYYQQVQAAMVYFSLTDNPALFTWRNKDNEVPDMELVPFDPEVAQQCMEWLAKILEAKRAEDLPQAGASMTAPCCKWCPHRERCWTAPVAAKTTDVISKPDWLA